ncbi:MAG: DNA polymerase III subunit delta [Patescibacteria group bacterium]
MIIFIHGEDTYRSSNYLKQTVDRFKKERDPQGLNVVVLDGQKDEAGRFWDEITAAPFLAERRMVVIKNVLSNKDADIIEALTEGIKKKRIPENNVAVFYQAEPLGKAKIGQDLSKLLAKEKWAMEFENLSGAKLSAWVKAEITQRGGKISQPAINYLCQNIGKDVWYLDSLMDQLVSFAEQKEISLSDAQLFLEEKIDDSIFNMVDSIIAGNRKLAFKLLQEQRRTGNDDMYIFGMILRQFRILIEMRDLYNREENITSDAVAKKLELHPFVVKKSLPLMKRYSLAKLKEVYKQLLDIDIKTKTGQGDQSLLIDLFVGKI